MEKTVKCQICGRPYKLYAFSAADQTACPACVHEAEKATQREDTPEEIRRRIKHFHGSALKRAGFGSVL